MAESKRILKRKEEGIFIYQLGDGLERFAVRMEWQGKDWRKFGFTNISQARKWRDTRRGRILEGRLFPEQEQAAVAPQESQIPLFTEYAERWLGDCETRGLKDTTLFRYQGLLRKHLKPAFKDQGLDAIKRCSVRQLVNIMAAQGATAKTIHNALAVVSAIYTQANEDELVEHNPAKNPSRLMKKTKRQDIDAFTYEEEQAILREAKTSASFYYPFILFLFRTGVREGEAVALRPEDLDFQSRYALISRNYTMRRLVDTPKGGRSRKVDLSKDLVETLKGHLTVQEAEATLSGQERPEWLFTSPQGELIHSNNFRDRVWRPLLKRLGLHYRNVHAIRHTFATRMIMNGANVVYVQKQLGHSTIQLTVDTYTHWIEEAERGRTLEVDRLAHPPHSGEAGTFAGTFSETIHK